jgi:GT2 family glycosyltransferase
MNCAVAIVNWNSGPWLKTCLESLMSAGSTPEIVVVDNASQDDSLEAAETFRDRVHFIRNSVNRGFAAAVNQAFQSTSSPYVLLLNPDVQASPEGISRLEKVLETQPRAAAIGGYIGEKYLPRNFPTIRSLLLENIFGKPNISALSGPGPQRVDQPAAAALLVRRDAFEEIGGLDEQFYPAWYEDVDFCRRLAAKGWEIHFARDVQFPHKGGYSADAMGQAKFLNAYYGNQFRYAKKHFGAAGALIVRASIVIGMALRMIGKPGEAAAYGKAALGALRGW